MNTFIYDILRKKFISKANSIFADLLRFSRSTMRARNNFAEPHDLHQRSYPVFLSPLRATLKISSFVLFLKCFRFLDIMFLDIQYTLDSN